MQQGVLGKMLRWGRLPLFQFGIEDAALVLCRIGQGGEFLLPVQDVCQHLAFHCFPAFLQNLLALGGKFLPGTFGGQQGFQIPEGLADCHQRPGDDELQNVLLAFRQRFQIGLQHTAGGQDGVVVGDFFPVDGAPCPGYSLVHIFWGNVKKAFQFLGQHLQHFLVIVGDIAAISPGISGKFLLIQALHIVQRLLCAVPQQAVGVPLKGGQVVQRRRILGFFLAGDALDRCHHLPSTGFQQVFCNGFFRNAAAGCRASAGQFQIHRVELFRHDSGLISEVDESNNKTTISLQVPFGGTQYFDNPDSPDDFTGTGGGEEQPTKPTPTTAAPTQKPTEAPTQAPTVAPTQKPTEAPTTKAPETTTKAPEVKYELSVQGLAWENASGSSELKEGDAVKFTALLYNNTGDDIPAGQAIGFKAVIDGSTTVKNEAYTGGLKAGETVKVTATTTWTAGYGGHTVVATATGDSQNSVTKKFNVGRKSANVTRVTGGYDLVVTDIEYDKNTVNAGDQLVFTATVMNAGDTDVPAGTVIGYQLQVDGNTSDIRWCDTYSSGLKAGASIKLTCNSGSNGINYWSATNGTHTVTAWVDDVNRLPNEVNENNNTTGITLVVPSAGLIENPDTPDDLDNIVIDPGKVTISSSVKIEGYQISTTLGGSRVVGSVEPTINNKAVKNWGFIYAVTKAGNATFDVSDDDMVVGTTSKYVTALESTPIGTAENVKFGSSDTATYFVRTTLFGTNTAKEYSAQYKVRAYAELSDGTYVYSKVSSYSVYDIADTLYSNKMMNTITAHDYLYNNILKVVNPDYAQVDYNWSNTVVDVSTVQ